MKFHEAMTEMVDGDIFKTDHDQDFVLDGGVFKCEGLKLTLTQALLYFKGKIIFSNIQTLEGLYNKWFNTNDDVGITGYLELVEMAKKNERLEIEFEFVNIV